MTGPDLLRLCQTLADDPDNTFESNIDWVDALQQGYASYQAYINRQNPQIFEKQFDFTVVNAGEYDLDGILFGANPSQNTIAQFISRIYIRNPGQVPDFSYELVACNSIEELWAGSNLGIGWVNARWTLQGTKLLFNAQMSQPLRLYYLPDAPPTSFWATAVSTPNSFIDNTPGFAQQLIAYFAMDAYAAKDWTDNPVVQRKMGQLMQQVDRWLTKGRNGAASRWVKSSRNPNGYGRGTGGY